MHHYPVQTTSPHAAQPTIVYATCFPRRTAIPHSTQQISTAHNSQASPRHHHPPPLTLLTDQRLTAAIQRAALAAALSDTLPEAKVSPLRPPQHHWKILLHLCPTKGHELRECVRLACGKIDSGSADTAECVRQLLSLRRTTTFTNT